MKRTLKLEKPDIKNFTQDISLQKEFSNAHINGYLIDAERIFNITNLILGDSKRKKFYKKDLKIYLMTKLRAITNKKATIKH